MVKKIIETTIEKNNLINAGEHIVIGLSGGPDSVCLFSVLNQLKEEMDFALYGVHVNHGFRPGAAEEDQAYVENLCREMNVPCSSYSYDCSKIAREEGLTDEEAGRKVRYKSFTETAEAIAAGGVERSKIKIAVAQNADDQAETVLLRLLRGTGPDGLSGIAYSREESGFPVIRPLLDTWRADIEAYCEDNNLQPRTDKTNLEPVYTRNKVRLQLIPYLQENFNPNIMESLERLSKVAGDDKAYLWQQAEKAYEEITVSPGILKQDRLAQLEPAIRHRVMMKALKEQGLTQDVTFVHLQAADGILEQEGESKTVEFPDGYRMSVRYGEAAFYKEGAPAAEGKLKVTVTAAAGDIPASAAAGDIPATAAAGDIPASAATFDYDKVTAVHGDAPVIFRSRREGDYIAIAGGRKKIKNLFIDMKIPKEWREHVKMAAVGSEILWLPAQPELGVKKARYNSSYKLDTDTKKALILEKDCVI